MNTTSTLFTPTKTPRRRNRTPRNPGTETEETEMEWTDGT
jgi:hypothetical protein